MTLKNRMRSVLLRVALSRRLLAFRRCLREALRRLYRRRHVVDAFLELDDPYSYLLASYLRELRDHYDIELRINLAEALGGGYRPAPQLYAEYALRDARRLARELGVPFLDRGDAPPVEHRRALLDALAARETEATFADDVIDAITAYWRGDAESVARRADGGGLADAMLARSRKRLIRLGHYDAAMLHYGGEWYWGIDRLHFLVDRLDALGAAAEPGLAPRIASIRQVFEVGAPVRPPSAAKQLPSIELFYSFRSPYSYLLLERLFRIADAFGIDVEIRPVLPMVMRGLPVPRNKLLYIVHDAAREAARNGVPFGRIADPLGGGAERCMAVFRYAQSQRRARDFVLAAGRAIWARGIDVATDEGLRKVTAKAGLFWPEVVAALEDNGWRAAAEESRAAMMAAGCWGVPTVRIGDWTVWGQDRDWLVARHLEDLCDSGEGILV